MKSWRSDSKLDDRSFSKPIGAGGPRKRETAVPAHTGHPPGHKVLRPTARAKPKASTTTLLSPPAPEIRKQSADGTWSMISGRIVNVEIDPRALAAGRQWRMAVGLLRIWFKCW